MAGIVTSNKTRKLVGNRLKEIDVPTATLNTSLYYADLSAKGVLFTQSRVNTELNAYPTVVKNNASLALTPSANKVGVVYAMNGDSKTLEEFEFQRGSSATFFSSSGVMGLAAPNEPRINFENGMSKGLLIEPSGSNLAIDSGFANGLESFAPKSAMGLSAVNSNFNIGTLLVKGIKFEHNADNIVFGYKTFSFSVGVTYTFSFFIKMDDESAPSVNDFRITIQAATLTSGFKITSVGNNVYRVSVQHIGISGGSQYAGIGKYNTNTTKSFIVSGYQLEEGSIATSYIPTTSAVVTRLADKVLSKRPLAVFNKNSFFVKTAEWPSVWLGNGVIDLTITQEAVEGMEGRNLIIQRDLISSYISSEGGRSPGSHPGTVPNNNVTTGFINVSGFDSITLTLFEDVLSPSGTARMYAYDEQKNPLRLLFTQTSGTFTQKNSTIEIDIEADVKYISATLMQVNVLRYKLEKGGNSTNWTPAPEDYIKIYANGNVEISYTEPIHIQQFSLISRELSQEEV